MLYEDTFATNSIHKKATDGVDITKIVWAMQDEIADDFKNYLTIMFYNNCYQISIT